MKQNFKNNPSLTQFCDELKTEIANYEKLHGRNAGVAFWIKAWCLLMLWASLYIIIVFYLTNYFLAFLLTLIWGVCCLLLVFNIGHDAVHGVISKSNIVNQIFKYSFNLVGGNAYSWKLKHNIAHHVHTNIEGLDFDTDLSPLIRLSPQSTYFQAYRVQHFTFLLIYPLFSLLTIIIGDFIIFSQAKKAKHVIKHPSYEWLILLLSKIWFIILTFVIPISYSHFSTYQICVAFFIHQLVNGILIAWVFMPSHYFPGAKYFNKKEINYNWFEHQLSTTMDLSAQNKLLSLFIGCLNHNVIHHLYPKFCHTHYFELTKLLKNKAKLLGITYHEMPYFDALKAHINLLQSLSKPND